MSTAKRIWITASIILIFVGIAAAFGSAYFTNFDLGALNNMNYEKTTYTVDEEFESIDIQAVESDIVFLSANDKSCTIHCAESDKIKHSVTVENKTLKITRDDKSKWYEHIGIFWGPESYSITVCLPQRLYDRLYISSVSGDMDIPENFAFSSVYLKSTSGDIKFKSETADGITAETISGDINLTNVRGGSAKLGTVSGDIAFSDAAPKDISFSTTSGDITVRNTKAFKDFLVNTVSGEIRLFGCDAPNIKIESTSGDVSGTLLSDKAFSASTISGDVNLPDSRSDEQKCEISTTSGNISFSVKP